MRLETDKEIVRDQSHPLSVRACDDKRDEVDVERNGSGCVVQSPSNAAPTSHCCFSLSLRRVSVPIFCYTWFRKLRFRKLRWVVRFGKTAGSNVSSPLANH